MWNEVAAHATGPVHALSVDELRRVADQVYARMRQSCAAIPPAHYTVDLNPDIGSHTLAYASANLMLVDELWVPAAATGYSGIHFMIRVNPTPPNNWWIGDCASIPDYRFDLQTVLMHEFLHGLGIFSLVQHDYTAGWSGYPSVFDNAMRDVTNQSVVYNGTFHALFGDPVHIRNVSIYNPSLFQPGSSLSHYTSEGVMRHAMHWSECVRTLDNDVRTLLRVVGFNCSAVAESSEDPFNVESFWIEALIVVGVILLLAICSQLCRSKKINSYMPI